MDMIKVQIISTETIKPSPSTPPHLKTFNLSLFDQSAPPVYVPILLFYSPTDDLKNHRKRWSDHLKKSLSKTLAHFYPFTGQINKDDAFTIDCNDRGATYVEAQIEANMSDVVLNEPEIDMLQRLLPCDPLEKFADPSSRVILAVQVNYFACGGMAIGVCIRHVIVDASATASFVKSWAATASGVNDIDVNGVIYDCTSLFPPQDLTELQQLMENRMKIRQANCVMKRFLFDGSKIAALRNKISMEEKECFYRPTRVEAVSALIWGAAIAMEKTGNIPMHVAVFPVNLRKIMNPVLPELCIGNIYQATMATSTTEKNVKHSNLAGKIHESIKRMKEEYVRKRGEYLNMMIRKNFGWGKPVWVATVLRLNKLAILLDASDGQGIEAWIGLTEEEMTKLEQDPEILAYASFRPSIS
ncbi:hypothetical protein SLEP1_g5236 [Rubroshorea leprosula]|uniref:Uncharacterized protein n=1 Tax=Rubroshorea leprosula TaxID=152421 RepID=A0AAV5HZ74_9ROSI|nr:hypothetical protein SLEP1_g5236 [Rubroshorea leprosula]